MSENKGFNGAETEDAATASTRPNLVISVQPHSQDSSRVELPVLTRDWQTNPRGQFIPVHGLDFLIGATSLLIQQTVELNDIASKIDSENRYIIRVPNGETLYIGSEASSPRQRCLCGSGRAFAMHLHDNTRQEALVLHRQLASASCLCPCRLQEMKVVMPPGEYVGRVQQQWTWLVPLYLVRGAADEVLYLIEGPARVRRSALQLAEFKDRVRTIKMAKTMHSIQNHALKRGDSVSETILSGDSLREVGKISHGWDRELVSFTTLVQLPDTAALPKHKALVLAAAFLLEYTYFEKSKRSCGLCC